MLTLLYSPFPSRESALTAANALLTQKLVACCNLIPGVESLYEWQGKLEQSQEVILLAKTKASHAMAAQTLLTRLHPYKCPAILTFSAEANAPYAQWVSAALAKL